MRLLPSGRYAVVPWRNGRGTTRIVHVEPPGATADDLLWQVSAPTIESDGPFSSLPGLDRHLVLLDGEGLVLRWHDEPSGADVERAIAHPMESSAFRGDWRTDCRLVRGPVSVLNVMTRRARFSARLSVLPVVRTLPVEKRAGTTLVVFAARGALRALGNGAQATLAPDDSLLLDAPGFEQVSLSPARGGGAVAIAVHLESA